VAWTTPISWVTGSVVTAAQLNQQLRDNLNFLFDPPEARIFNAAVSVASGTVPGALSLPTVVWDSTGSTMTSAAGKITIPLAGVYEVNGGGVWGASATGVVRRLGFLYPGPTSGGTSLVQNSNNITVEQTASDMTKFAANDTVQLAGAQNSGGALNLTNAVLIVAWAGAG